MRLIDADELYDAMRETAEEDVCDWDAIQSGIWFAPTIGSAIVWHNAKTETPPKYGEYLIVHSYKKPHFRIGLFDKDRYINGADCWYVRECDTDCEKPKLDWEDVDTDHVPYWAELPEMPEKQHE